MPPLIGLTTNYEAIDATLRDRYYNMVVRAGGVPILIPPVNDEEVVERTLDHLDGLILTGGGDYGVTVVRDMPEIMAITRAHERNIPMLGICRGVQMMAIALGGEIYDDIGLPNHNPKGENIDGRDFREIKTHPVTISNPSILYKLFAREEILTNSFHHQAVSIPPKGFIISALATDGTIEAMESSEGRSELGVQWHPEWLDDGLPLFSWLINEAKLYAEAKNIHKQIITLDSHCDTPMFFDQGANFLIRDNKIKVDLPKMRDGLLDVATFVAYIPQGIDHPFEYAQNIYNQILTKIKISKTKEDILKNKALGKPSIMLGLENASAIEHKLERVQLFKNQGVKYFTLCHNGDNQVCDSARRSNQTWGGLSPFGRELIQEMNHHGILVDLSHAAETSFYDALDLSTAPVVCSHSNCKAICNHERNITDDQLIALAKKGGVCQLTLYEGFVANNIKQADIHRFMEHLDHAVNLVGVEHIGFGSDFDGDGGIPGLNDASDALQYTKELLRRKFNFKDIELLWGLNWLRLL